MVSSSWMQEVDNNYRQQHGISENMLVSLANFPTPSRVSGSGHGVQEVRQKTSIPIGIPLYGTTSLQALVLPQGEAPALLCLRSRQERKCILDIRRGMCHMWIAEDLDDIQIEAQDCSSNTAQRLQVEQGGSGHLTLPCIAFSGSASTHK